MLGRYEYPAVPVEAGGGSIVFVIVFVGEVVVVVVVDPNLKSVNTELVESEEFVVWKPE